MAWYHDAVFYEVYVRGFYDSNGDGQGDIAGLTAKLDHLAQLGVDCLWLLPFYPSPRRDDGYDVTDFCGVHTDYGTLEDVDHLLAEAHRRGIRVIADLVLNHCSDKHPWFESARRGPGAPYHDWFVWSATPDRYRDVRVIFKDSEPSNWTHDPVSGLYYWHRFFHHQPDLNYENPAVQEEMLRVVDFWLARGFDGFRCDAVPYLFEREGTECAGLPETHAFLRRLRAHVDAKFPDRVLIAEANQWPEDLVPYFGDGDEFHMAFHFPIMPRLFMGLRKETARPIVEILARTPAIPASCQWGVFLRNHDELTLEMVTDEERDYLFHEYARDPKMRINAGIRRRLAPLLDNGRRRIELLHAILFALPGAPFLYYGDEIGMGDNVYLGDRNGVRTPMQWSSDRNAGFSRADEAALYSPVIRDHAYHYQTVNVETQRRHGSSLLSWLEQLVGVRKRAGIFGRAALRMLAPTNDAILAFVREHEGKAILCAHNLARTTQPFSIDLSPWAGRTPVEMLGGARFPTLEAGVSSFFSLGPHDFVWLELEPRRA